MPNAKTTLDNPPPRERGQFLTRRFRGQNGKYFWTLISRANGEPIGRPAEGDGFTRKLDCLINMFLVTGFSDLDEDLDHAN